MKKGKLLENTLVGGVGISLAMLSRFYCPEEVASIIGGYETKALAEHFLSALSVCELCSIPSNIFQSERSKYVSNMMMVGYVFNTLVHEYDQSLEKGFYQLNQILADFTGVGLAYLSLNYDSFKEKFKNKETDLQ
jgi:hypothetical protein